MFITIRTIGTVGVIYTEMNNVVYQIKQCLHLKVGQVILEKPARVRKNLKIHNREKSATSLQSPSSNTHERAHDQWGHEVSLCTDGRLTGR